MKLAYFTERPVRWVPEEVILKNGAHFAVSNSYFDREKAAEDYNYYIDENSTPRNSASTSSRSTSITAIRFAWAA